MAAAKRSGAAELIGGLADLGVTTYFANPGTTEMWLVGALDARKDVRAVLCLHENVCSGAADGFARMSRAPAATLLHLGVGLGNAVANLHNARRACVPVINVVGEMATWHCGAGAPLETDIERIAAAVSSCMCTVKSAADAETDAVAVVAAAMKPGCADAAGRVATLIVPHDVQWTQIDGSDGDERRARLRRALTAAATPAPVAALGAGARTFIESAAKALRAAPRGRAALYLGGRALLAGQGGGLVDAGRAAAALGAELLCMNGFARADRGAGRPPLRRLPYFPSDARKELAQYDVLLIADAPRPVAMFGYDGGVSQVLQLPDDAVWELDAGDMAGALAMLADCLGAPAWDEAAAAAAAARPSAAAAPPPDARLTAAAMCAAVAAAQPAGAIISDESLTSGTAYWAASAASPPFSHLTLTGGAIGQGLPVAVGAAVACPDRKVISLQADGSGLYSPQALWTQAREGLDVVTIICANRTYNILKLESALQRCGGGGDGAVMRSLTSLEKPAVDWCKVAEGFGVPASRAATVGEFTAALAAALSRRGPALIEAVLQ